MATKLIPYLGFRGNAREAMEFYHSVFGGKLDISTFAEFQAAQDPSEENLVMHAQLVTPGDLTLMGSDTPERMPYNPGDTFSVSLFGDDDAELRGFWDGLVAGGTVVEPLTVAAWGDAFGMLKDSFGIAWMVNISATQPS